MIRVAVEVTGDVQGVGFRPLVARAASARGLGGVVRNGGGAVHLEVEGPADAVRACLDAVRAAPPPVRIATWTERSLPPRGAPGFAIGTSRDNGWGAALVPDLAPCPACAAEVTAATGRRAGYAFTACATCGPRLSIAPSPPFDRARTSLAGFPTCDACRAEHDDPADRRFHAQTLACPTCGPRLALLGPDGAPRPGDPLDGAADLLRTGGVVALKGVGGFQLVADAAHDGAVARIRAAKQRPDRPLAVLVGTVDDARALGDVDAAEAALLAAPHAPIVLLRRRLDAPLADGVTRGLGTIGVMLPASPLHLLLARAVGRPLVCTSANRRDQPLPATAAEVRADLGPDVDAVLDHDRPVVVTLDDGVERVVDGAPLVLRRARGRVPRALADDDGPCVLAVGGHLKVAPAVAFGTTLLPGAHVGDLGERRTLRRLEVELGRLRAGATLHAVACDRHDDLGSSPVARRLADALGVPCLGVGHHHAHVAAVVAEHGLRGPVLGLAWDGTGLGDDGTPWGAEALVVDGGRCARVASLVTFPLPGGDAAARDPRRSFVGLAVRAGLDLDDVALRPLVALAADPALSPRVSSMGRLFDAVAFALGLGDGVTFEAHAALRVEDAAATAGHAAALPDLEPIAGDVVRGDPGPLLAALVDARRRGIDVPALALGFHRALARWAAAVARHADLHDVALAGGCFQNAVLAREVASALRAAGLRPHLPRELPPNDGALAVGQAWVARRWLARGAAV